jgi:hypothetical protein
LTPALEAMMRVIRAIEDLKAPLDSETAAQQAIMRALVDIDAEARAEVRLSPTSRIDFTCTIDGIRVGIEVKIDKGNRREIYRQIERYAAIGSLDAIVLASNRAIGLPETVVAIPVGFASLGRGWL